jgi:hypothetical protein
VANGPGGKRKRGNWAADGKEGEEEGLRFVFFKSCLNNFSNLFKSNLLHFFTTFFTNYFKDF